MRYLSLFSGIEAATAAWEPLGWTPVAFAEIEPFPCAVLAHRFPSVPNLGDVTQITAEQIAALGQIDVVIGGSPCQDLSVAGKRAGLRGERSSLFHEQVRIFNAARTLCGARWLVWENVPGAFSTHGGRDFAQVVGDLAGCELPVPGDGWGTEGVALGVNGLVEWAVLDAQFFGVAQRRRRVFAILDVGNWRDRPPVLLEPESLRGNPPARGEAGQDASARTLRSSDGGVDREDGHSLIAHALDAFSSGRATEDGTGRGVPLTAHALRADGFDASEDGTGRGTPLVPEVVGAINDGAHYGGGRTVRMPIPGDLSLYLNAGAMGRQDSETETLIPERIGGGFDVLAFDETQITHRVNRSKPGDLSPSLVDDARPPTIAFSCKDHGADAQDDIAPTLRAMHEAEGNANAGGRVAIAFESRFARNGRGAPDEVVPPLKAQSGETGKGDGAPLVAFADTADPVAANQARTYTREGSGNFRVSNVAHTASAVRRLTPRECERLQGFPDDWTLVEHRGKPAADGPRYRALGNSMAVPVIRWIGRRIDAAIRANADDEIVDGERR